MTPAEEIAALTEQLSEAKADLVAAEAEIEDLKMALGELEDELDAENRLNSDEFIPAETVADFKRLVKQQHYDEALDLIDRELPARLRYA